MCGVIGVYGYENVATDIINGLETLQHRGQDSAGLVVFNGTFKMHKGNGSVSTVFKNLPLERFKGEIGLGHVRYSTIGSTEAVDAQPIAVNYPYGLAMVHNGNVVNFNELRRKLYEEHHRLLDTSNDVALILYTLATQLEKKDLRNLTVEDVFDSVRGVQDIVQGAYSAITIIANKGFLAFTDPYGIRPLVLGRKFTDKGVVYAFASESTTFDFLGYEKIRDLRPGEMVFIDEERRIHAEIGHVKRQAFCVFEYIYFAREDSVIHDRLVASERVRMGKRLAQKFKQTGLQPDIIIDVPNSAYFLPRPWLKSWAFRTGAGWPRITTWDARSLPRGKRNAKKWCARSSIPFATLCRAKRWPWWTIPLCAAPLPNALFKCCARPVPKRCTLFRLRRRLSIPAFTASTCRSSGKFWPPITMWTRFANT